MRFGRAFVAKGDPDQDNVVDRRCETYKKLTKAKIQDP